MLQGMQINLLIYMFQSASDVFFIQCISLFLHSLKTSPQFQSQNFCPRKTCFRNAILQIHIHIQPFDTLHHSLCKFVACNQAHVLKSAVKAVPYAIGSQLIPQYSLHFYSSSILLIRENHLYVFHIYLCYQILQIFQKSIKLYSI